MDGREAGPWTCQSWCGLVPPLPDSQSLGRSLPSRPRGRAKDLQASVGRLRRAPGPLPRQAELFLLLDPSGGWNPWESLVSHTREERSRPEVSGPRGDSQDQAPELSGFKVLLITSSMRLWLPRRSSARQPGPPTSGQVAGQGGGAFWRDGTVAETGRGLQRRPTLPGSTEGQLLRPRGPGGVPRHRLGLHTPSPPRAVLPPCDQGHSTEVWVLPWGEAPDHAWEPRLLPQ